MAEAKNDYSPGDKVNASDLNGIADTANDGGGFRDDLDAGETINGGTLPVAVYQDTSDNELYACDGNDTAKLNFIGFATSNSTDGNPIDFQGNGIVGGFTGLAEGEYYYVQDDKTIGTSQGTYAILVGIAVSTTEILIFKRPNIELNTQLIASDTLKQSADTERTGTDNSYVLTKEIVVFERGTIRVKFDLGLGIGVGQGYGQIYVNGVAVGTERTNSSTTYQTFSEDIDIERGDLIQLYAKNPSGGDGYKVRNFRIYYDVVQYKEPFVNTD